MNLSSHFTLEEFTRSDTAVRLGIDNTPSTEIIENLKNTAAGLERVRSVLKVAMFVTSGYRCIKLNIARKGSKTSQHVKGEAIDFVAPDFGDALAVCREIVRHRDEIGFDQLIYEGTWIHISFSDDPRDEVLTAKFSNGTATYTRGLP